MLENVAAVAAVAAEAEAEPINDCTQGFYELILG